MKDKRLAVLIDADNVPYSNVKEMLNEIAKYDIDTLIVHSSTKQVTANDMNNLLAALEKSKNQNV